MSDRSPFRALDPEGVADGDYVVTVSGGHVTGLTAASAGGGSGVVETIVPGAGIAVDDSDPANPVVSATGGGGGGGSDPTVLVLPTTVTWDLDYPDGIFNVLGRVLGGGVFSNPALGGVGLYANSPQYIAVSQSSNLDGTRTADKAVDHSLDEGSGCIHTTNTANSWWQVDFLADKKFAITRLALVGRSSGGSHPRNFKLQGSNDASAWSDLITVAGAGPSNSTWWSSDVSGAGAYRYLRILQTGPNVDGYGYLVIGEVEMWGTLSAV